MMKAGASVHEDDVQDARAMWHVHLNLVGALGQLLSRLA